MGLPWWLSSKESTCNEGDSGSILRSARPPEEGMATHSIIVAWRIPWTEEPGGLHPWGDKESDTIETTEHIGAHVRAHTHTHTHTYPHLHPHTFSMVNILQYGEFTLFILCLTIESPIALNEENAIKHLLYLPVFSSVQYSRSVVSDSLRPHESQHARPPCPSPTPGVHSGSRPSSQ